MWLSNAATLNQVISSFPIPESKSTHPRILIADDQPDVLLALRLLLKREGYRVEIATSPAAVLQALSLREYDLLLTDLNYTRDTTSGREGLDLLEKVHETDPSLPVVVMTAWATVDVAVSALRRGVRDFVQKPWENAQLLGILDRQIEWGRQQRRRQEELDAARNIQEGLLPRDLPFLGAYKLSGLSRPVSGVGGDYYDAFKLGDHHLAVCIADVAGKGMPAALLMANLQAVVKAFSFERIAFASESVIPQELCAKMNQVICRNIGIDRFISLFYGVVDTEKNELIYTDAGHNSPMLVRRDGSSVKLDRGGLVLGVDPQAQYEQGKCFLAPGDRLVLFTDGVTEVTSPEGEEFGEARLLQLLIQQRHLNARELQGQLMQAVTRFSRGCFRDDAAVLVMAVGN
jgi:sigma-B regulation protein RsbU (phosphoserine phosphatase)